MSTIAQSIGGEAVTTKLAMRMEDSLQAFAVRAACFIGELDVPYSEEFDGHDFGATHIIACVGEEPVGAVRVRWFQSFAMVERLAVIQRFRGHGIGQLLVERCRTLAGSRGCNMLYLRVVPGYAKFLEKQGWQCLPPGDPAVADRRTVALMRSVDLTKARPELNALDVLTLSQQFGRQAPSGPQDGAAVLGRRPSGARNAVV
jgi:GNAT superfamily N-acetyltransferase